MNHLNVIVSTTCIVVSILVSRFLTLRIIDGLTRQAEQRTHFLTTLAGSALLFATVFVVVWCAVSFVAYLPWLHFLLWQEMPWEPSWVGQRKRWGAVR